MSVIRIIGNTPDKNFVNLLEILYNVFILSVINIFNLHFLFLFLLKDSFSVNASQIKS